jgi:hypothetical protein
MKNKKQANINLLGIAGLIIALSIGYYFVIYIPQKDRLKEESAKQLQQQVEANRVLLNNCLISAEVRGSNFWDSECEGKGLKEDCRLPTYNADRVDNHIKDDKNECFKKYPQN